MSHKVHTPLGCCRYIVVAAAPNIALAAVLLFPWGGGGGHNHTSAPKRNLYDYCPHFPSFHTICMCMCVLLTHFRTSISIRSDLLGRGQNHMSAPTDIPGNSCPLPFSIAYERNVKKCKSPPSGVLPRMCCLLLGGFSEVVRCVAYCWVVSQRS